ncbi:DNA-formamidopyrimidine glycosylase family protein [Miltoncostaea oceani]|uniref:DNA-formamidopyrimidine glycosylase family protein n=1 Tax=Miltoncostaea oceani TaxID=2843216 RepID=UPI001C3D7C16|nr:DNA-formamidopyrimidine glycosylase family protein [Miltoncostaea oceani]
MPELPELQALAEGLTAALAGRLITDARVHQHHTLKTAVPPIGDLAGRRIARIWRRGKILGVEAEGDRTLVIHLMQAGRLGVAAAPAGRPGRTAAIDLGIGEGEVLRLRELSTTRRASAHLLDAAGLAEHRPLTRLGPEPIGLDAAGWRDALTSGRGAVLHTALRDGRRVAGIGRAYASDIMWAARLAPFARVASLDDDAYARLARAADAVLVQALDRARERITTDLPNREQRVTAVHRHHGEPCLRCGTRLEHVAFREYDLVYCPACQTGGTVYRDRRMSRFLD